MAARPYAARAPRFALPLDVLFRTNSERAWLEGRTENISKSGMLIRARRVMTPETTVELLLNFPPDLPAPFTGTTICRGRIVRAVDASGAEDRPAFAAAIFEYETRNVVDPRRI